MSFTFLTVLVGSAYAYLLLHRDKLSLQDHIYFISAFTSMGISVIITLIYPDSVYINKVADTICITVIVLNIALSLFKKDYPKLKEFVERKY